MRVGVVGLGAVTQSVHLPLLARRWDLFDVVALADLSPSRVDDVAARYGVAGRFTSVEDMVAAHASGEIPLDGVLVATPGTHGPAVLALVRAGVAVLCEKPLTLSEAEIDEIAAVPGARVQVGYMKEYDPATARARTELEGRTVRAVTVEVLHPSSAAQLAFARLLPAATDIDGDRLAAFVARSEAAVDAAVGTGLKPTWRALYEGVVLGSIVHDISLLRHLGLGVESVESATRWGEHGADPGSVEVVGTTAGGARLHLGWHYLPDYPDYRETVTFHHDGGSVSLVFGIPYLLNAPTVLTVVSSADGGEVRSEHRWNQQEGFENELAAFHAFVTGGAAPHSGPEQARADLVVAQRVLAGLGRRHDLAVGGEAATR